MTKLELNNKLAELYGLPKNKDFYGKSTLITRYGKPEIKVETEQSVSTVLLIDDWSTLMNLAIGQLFTIEQYGDMQEVVIQPYHEHHVLDALSIEKYSNHESPQAATRFAIAMALVKVAEMK